MAGKKTENTGLFTTFTKPAAKGQKGEQIAINLSRASVIETDGPEHFFIYAEGSKHRVASDSKTLADVLEASGGEAE
jgi:hypothetical protein